MTDDPTTPTAHDHGNCALCDQIEAALLACRQECAMEFAALRSEIDVLREGPAREYWEQLQATNERSAKAESALAACQQSTVAKMHEAHGLAQESTIRDVNAGLIDDYIALRLERVKTEALAATSSRRSKQNTVNGPSRDRSTRAPRVSLQRRHG